MRRATAGLALAAALAASVGARAQIFGHHPRPSQSQSGPQQIDCGMAAANPDAGMDRASCEQMNQAALAYYNAQHDPSAVRPGDEQMSCEDIKAEFMRQPVTAPNAQHVAAAQGATSAYMAETHKLEGEAAAASAALSAQAAAASALSVANPLAGRAADQVVNQEIEATQRALNAQARAEATPLARNMNSATAAVVGDASSQLQDNPRTARLVALANEKHCRGW